MSTTIDQRVVEMQFDNKQFEQNVSTTMSTLDKLKQSLKLTGATKGFDDIGTAAKSFSLSGIGTAVDTVQAKFSALGVMGATALANITNSAVNAGKRIVSALTVDPVKTGFQEYETQINAVQTILANTSSKGKTIEDVNKALDELNKYADQTIYNFTEMTRNIGTFTAAGIDLDTSVSAIQGIANLAAVSGSTSQQASTAMYQLSQALASGTVKLMDWNSVVNAGMGGELFQNALKETSALLGTGAEAAITAEGSFRESLKTGWLTAEVLTETLKKFTESGATEQVAKFTGLSQDVVQAALDSAKAQYGEAEAIEYASKALAEKSGKNADEIKATLEFARNATDAATKVKTLTQLWDVLKESAQSGWSQTWRILVGDFEEAKGVFTPLANALTGFINQMSEARNMLLAGAMGSPEDGLLDGRTLLLNSLKNVGQGIIKIFTTISNAWRDIFKPMDSKQLYDIIAAFNSFSEKLIMSDETADKLKRTFKGLFAILDIAKQAIGAVVRAIAPLFGGLDDLSGGILNVTATWGDWLVAFSETLKTTDVLDQIAGKIAGFIEKIKRGFQVAIEAIRSFRDSFKEKFDVTVGSPDLSVLEALLERIKERFSMIRDAAIKLKDGVVDTFNGMGNALADCDFFKLLGIIWDGVVKISSGIGNAIGGLIGSFVNTLGNANYEGFFDFINSLSFATIGVFIAKFVKGFSDITDSIGGFGESALKILDEVRGCFEAFQTQLKAGALVKIASAIAILVASILVLSLIDSDKLSTAVGAITLLFADLMTSMAAFSKISTGARGMLKSITAMLGISVAVLLLASALKKISDLEPEQLAVGLVGIATLTATMIAAAKIMGSGGDTIIKGAAKMVVFALAIKVLASVCTDLAQLNWNELIKGLVGVGVIMGEVSLFMNTAKFSGKSISTATGMVILAAAIKILASACADFAQLSWGEISKGLVSVGALLLAIAGFTMLTNNATGVMSTGIGLIALAAAMKIFASVMQDMGTMPWEGIAKGLVTIAGALAITTAALRLMPKDMLVKGVGLIAVAGAIVVLAEALERMGAMSWEGIAKGLVALGGAIIILAAGLVVMTGTLAGSAAMIVAAGAIAILVPSLMLLSTISWEGIAKGLVAIAGAFAILGVAGFVLGPLVPVILSLSAAITLIGVGIVGIGGGLLLAGLGLSAIAAGFTALATSLSLGTTAIVAGLSVVVMGVVSLIPQIIEVIGEAIVEFCRVIAESAPAIAQAVKSIVLSLVDVLVECVPAIAEGALQLVVGVMSALVTYTPQVIDLLFDFLIGAIRGLAERLPDLIQAGFELIASFFTGVVDALKGIDTTTLIQGVAGVGLMSGIMLALSAVAALVPGAMIGVLGMGAVIAELAIVLAAIGGLAQIPGLDWLIGEGGKLLESIGTAIGSFIGGIVGGVMSGVTSQFPQIGEDLSAFMTNAKPFIDGAKKIDSAAMSGVKSLVDVILALTAVEILDGLTSWFTGGSSLEDFGAELARFGPHFNDYYESIKGIDGGVVVASANAALALAEMASTLPNSGGIAEWFTGENSLSAFADELVIFGPKLKAYADSVAGLDASVVVNSANAALALSEMAAKLPNSGGIVGWFAGENSLSMFADELSVFGPKLKAYADSVAGLDESVVTNSTNAALALSKMAENLPNSGGMLAWFTGDNTLSAFAEELMIFGPKLKAYGDSVAGLDVEAVNASVSAVGAIADIATELPNTGGIVSWFAGDNDISSFGESLVDLGEAMHDYSDEVADINTAALTIATTQFGRLVGLAEDTANVNFNGLSSFADALGDLGDASVDEFISAFQTASDDLAVATEDMMSVMVTGFESKKDGITEAFNAMIRGAIDSINNCLKDFETAGVDIITGFMRGVREEARTATKTFTDVAKGGYTYIRNEYQNYYDAGAYLVSGFANGISSNTYKATAKSQAMAKAALQAAQKTLGINSPSREFFRIGKYTVMGFVNALTSYSDQIHVAGSGMAESARSGFTSAISKLHDAIDTNIDAQPTIRPVLDLSDVAYGASQISDIFGSGASMGVLANVSGISSMMNRRGQNGVNDDVVLAIDKLRKELNERGGDTYQINGITYDDGSNISTAVKALTRAALRERRV